MASIAPRPTFMLLTQTLPRRSQSSIRRTLVALGATVHVATSSTDCLPNGTSYVLLTEQVACPVFVLAVASASTVRLVTPAFVEDCEKYNTLTPPHSDSHTPSDDSSSAAFLDASDILWIGRIWLGAYQYWRSRTYLGKCAPLHSHRILVVGQTRPRGAARLLSPSSAFVKDLIIAAGAQLLEYDQADASTFAIVAPGLNRSNSDVVASLLDNDVICFAPAFLLDLILRVVANPVDYLLFSSQKFLCAACLDSKSIFAQHPPLKVSTRDIEQPSSISTIPKIGVAPTLNPHLKSNENNSNTGREIPSRKKRNSARSLQDRPPAKRKRPSQSAMTLQPDSVIPHYKDGSIEIIDLTHPPKQDNLEIGLFECCQPSPIGSDLKKHSITISRRRCPNDQNSCKDSSGLRCGIEIQPSLGGQTTPPQKFDSSHLKKSEHPPNKVTEDACHTSSGEGANSLSRKTLLSPNMCLMRKELEISFSQKGDSEYKAKAGQCVGNELTQVPIFDEAGSSQRDRFTTIGKNGNVHHKSFQSTEQLDPSPRIANSTHTMPTKSYHTSGEHEGSGCRNGCPERLETSSTGQREHQGHGSDGKCLETRDWSVQPKRLSNVSDMISSEKLELPNSTVNFKSTRTTRHCANKNGSSSFNNQTSNTRLTQPQRPQNKEGMPNYDFEPDFHLVMTALGGQPSDRTIKLMLKSIAAPKTWWASVEQGSSEVDETASCRSRVENSDRQKQRLQNLPENLNGLHYTFHGTSSWGDGLHQGDHEIEFPPEQGRRAENEESLPMQVCVSSMLPPKEPITIRNVTRPELVFLENADSVDIVTGNENDDHVCQSSLSFVDWLIGAENFVGSVSTDALTSTQSVTNSLSRRVWLSLFEAKVFERLAIPGGLNDFHISVLVGICARLVTCNFQPEMNIRVLSELLKLRELQKTSKLDSLTVVLSSSDLCSIPYRHRAVATIWAMVLQSATWNSNTYCGWALLEKGFQNCFEDVFNSSQQLKGLAAHVSKKINTFLEVLWTATLTLSLRTDLFGTEPQPSSGSESSMYPENWNVFVRLFDRFQNVTLSTVPSSRHVLRQMLKTVLKFITEKYCEVLWQVNEEFLIACTQIVGRICEIENVSCFCENITPHPEHFVDRSQSARSGLSKDFKTECEYLFYFSRNLINHGLGNKMKHVMNIMRIASTFTASEGANCESRLRKTRHHVGLILSVADFVANCNGENQVCNILTIKSEDFSILLGNKSVNYREIEQRWECILKGVVERCQASIKRCEGGHVYVKWMLSSVTEGLILIKRIGERRACGTGDRELLRAQESTLWTVTLKRFSGLKVILQLLIKESGLETMSKDVSINFLDTILNGLSTLLRQLREWNDGPQVASVVVDSVKRENLVHEIIEVAGAMVNMVLIVLSLSRHPNGNYSQSFRKRFTDVFCEKNLDLILCLILGTNMMQQKEHRVDCMENLMGMLAVFIDMFYANEYDGWNESDFNKLREALGKSGLDFLSRSAPAYASDLVESESSNSAVVQFWWRAITKLSWVQGAVRKDNHLKGVIVSVVLWIIVQEGRLRRLENEKAERMIKEVRRAIQSVEGIGLLFKKWKSYIELGGEEIYEDTNAICVQQAIEHSVKDWGRFASSNVVSHLRRGVHDMIRSKRGNIAEDGMQIAGYLFNLECQALGLCPGKRELWMSERIADICDSVDFLRHSGGWRCGKSWDIACEAMLESILSGLSMSRCSELNVELRVVVLRLVNVVGDANDLSGVWRVTERRLLFAKGTSEDAEVILRGTIMENLGQWQEFILHGAVEDRLSCVSKGGQGRVLALRRLLAAARVGEHPKFESLVRAVVGRIQWNKRVESAICSDAISRLLWRQIVRLLERSRA